MMHVFHIWIETMSLLMKAAKSLIPEQMYDVLRRARQDRMTRRFKSYEARHRFGGRELNVYIADPVAVEWYDHSDDENREIDFFRRFDLQGGMIFDLGAHQCVVAMLLADFVGDDGRVIAVEANKHNYEVSLRNLALNDKHNVTCLNGLVSSGRMQVSIDGGLNGRARATSGISDTPVLTIDQMTASYGAPSLVVLDIEGHEIEALGSATNTISNTHAHWLIELHGDELLGTYGHRSSDIFRFFNEKDFIFHVLVEGASEFTLLNRDDLPSVRCQLVFERR